jgi:hypothetical protein
MQPNRLLRAIDKAWLWVKRLAAKCALLVFGLGAIFGFGVVAVELGLEGLDWLKTGNWQSAKPIAEAWPALADFAARIEWIGARRVGLWMTAQPVTWAYLAFGLTCFVIYGLFLEVRDRLDKRWHERHDHQ